MALQHSKTIIPSLWSDGTLAQFIKINSSKVLYKIRPVLVANVFSGQNSVTARGSHFHYHKLQIFLLTFLKVGGGH